MLRKRSNSVSASSGSAGLRETSKDVFFFVWSFMFQASRASCGFVDAATPAGSTESVPSSCLPILSRSSEYRQSSYPRITDFSNWQCAQIGPLPQGRHSLQFPAIRASSSDIRSDNVSRCSPHSFRKLLQFHKMLPLRFYVLHTLASKDAGFPTQG